MWQLTLQWTCYKLCKTAFGSGEIRTRASEETGALNQRLRPLGHATSVAYDCKFSIKNHGFEILYLGSSSCDFEWLTLQLWPNREKNSLGWVTPKSCPSRHFMSGMAARKLLLPWQMARKKKSISALMLLQNQKWTIQDALTLLKSAAMKWGHQFIRFHDFDQI